MISVIIPVYNEGTTIAKLVDYLLKNGQGEIEVLIIDGGSTDATIEQATNAGATVIKSHKKGRANQMNVGAQNANGDIFYFLHADTYPPQSFTKDIKKSLASGAKAGCYRLAFDSNHPALTFYCWFTRFDINLFRFGDQSLFVKKSIFESIGGFNEQLIVMEDQEIVRSIKRKATFEILDKQVVTSARKYLHVGVYKLQLIFTAVLLMYYIGIDQQSIVNFYTRKIK